MAQTAAPHTLVLPIAPERLPPPQAPVEVDGLRLDPKPELHDTLVGTAPGAELHATFGNRATALILPLRDTHHCRFHRRGSPLLPLPHVHETGRAALSTPSIHHNHNTT